MIEKLYTIESGSLNPYLNMVLEEYKHLIKKVMIFN